MFKKLLQFKLSTGNITLLIFTQFTERGGIE